MWSLGIAVLEMAAGRHPWPPFEHQAALVYHIGSLHEKPHSKPSLESVLAPRHRSAHQQHPPSSQNPASSAALVNLVEMCLEIDPNRRPTAEELEQHPAFNAIS